MANPPWPDASAGGSGTFLNSGIENTAHQIATETNDARSRVERYDATAIEPGDVEALMVCIDAVADQLRSPTLTG